MTPEALDFESIFYLHPRTRNAATTDKVCIEGTEAIATSPEGSTARMSLEMLLAKIAARRMDTGGVILPDGIKAVVSEGPVTIWIYESPPQVRRFSWIAPDSPVPFGRGTKYHTVRIGTPYIIMLTVFAGNEGGPLQLTSANECFFRTAPLRSLDDDLFFPALLNCSKFVPPEGRPLSWICTQHLKATPAMHDPDLNKRLTASFEALRRCLFETGFNYSSENHEASSWFTESRQVDPRVATVEAWEAASAKDPLFVLDVPWLKTGYALRQVLDRIFRNQNARKNHGHNAAALARLIFNHAK